MWKFFYFLGVSRGLRFLVSRWCAISAIALAVYRIKCNIWQRTLIAAATTLLYKARKDWPPTTQLTHTVQESKLCIHSLMRPYAQSGNAIGMLQIPTASFMTLSWPQVTLDAREHELLRPESISDGSTFQDGKLSHGEFLNPKKRDEFEACPLCVANYTTDHFLWECVAVSDLCQQWLRLGNNRKLWNLIQYHCCPLGNFLLAIS